jgi:hypothetical protein|tara:strand:- start:1283 stop:1474 length:192 start_codon:yes stop_codon:yes gene_type:complete
MDFSIFLSGGLATKYVRVAIIGTKNHFGLYNLEENYWEWIADNYVDPCSTVYAINPLIEISGL